MIYASEVHYYEVNLVILQYLTDSTSVHTNDALLETLPMFLDKDVQSQWKTCLSVDCFIRLRSRLPIDLCPTQPPCKVQHCGHYQRCLLHQDVPANLRVVCPQSDVR